MLRLALMNAIRWLVWVALSPLSFAQSGAQAGGLEIQFSPIGLSPGTQQVRATFNQPMTSVGQLLTTPSPFEIQCPTPGKSRWENEKTWIYDFNQKVPAGSTCLFRLKNTVKSLSGEGSATSQEFSFSTGIPSVLQSWPSSGEEVEEDPAFVLRLDGSVDRKWVVGHSYFAVEGIQEQIPVEVLSSDKLSEVLKNVDHSQLDYFKENPDSIYLIHPKRVLPNSKGLKLIWKGQTEQTFNFTTRPEFTAQFSCEREKPESGCIPILPMSLRFNREISSSYLKKIYIRDSTGKAYPASSHSSASTEGEELGEPISSVFFKGPFPEKGQLSLEIPKIRDRYQQGLANQASFPLKVITDEFPPLAKFAADFGILEANPGAMLPVTLRNLDPEAKIKGRILRVEEPSQVTPIIEWMFRLNRQQHYLARDRSILAGEKTEHLTLPKPNGSKAFEVVGVPLKRPGFYVVEIGSKALGNHLLGTDSTMYVSTAALVTQMGVHFKKGNSSSLVWVTRLENSQPISGARVKLMNCKGEVLSSGQTDREGRFHVGALPQEYPDCHRDGEYSPYQRGIFVTAEKDGDFSFVHSEWNRGIESWRFNLEGSSLMGPEVSHTVLDRSLLRVGDTLHMKHFYRVHTERGIEMAPAGKLPTHVNLIHSGSNEKHTLPLKWDSNGIAFSDWVIPSGAKLGQYRIFLEAPGSNPYYTSSSAEFRVEEFRIPLMKGTIHFPTEKMVVPPRFDIDLAVDYLNGGAAGKLPVQFRYLLSERSMGGIGEKAFEEFSFDNGYPRERQYVETETEKTPDDSGPIRVGVSQNKSLILDQHGSARVGLNGVSPIQSSHVLEIEMEYRDPNGEVQTVSSQMPVYSSSRLVGIRRKGVWTQSKSHLIEAAVVDLQGNPVVNAPVDIQFFEEKYYSHRNKLVGGFYAYENHYEIKKLGRACQGNTDFRGVLQCTVQPPKSGSLVLVAETKDNQGRKNSAHSFVSVYSGNESWFSQNDDDRIDLISTKKTYEVGEKAVFEVRMPFREATALVTVEREGILDSFVVPLKGSQPLVEVPIQKNYAPNVYISVLVVRGRVGNAKPTSTVDLGKPAFKLGLASIRVGWRPHELKVKLSSAKDVYQVREKAKVQIHVETSTGEDLSPGAEVALAAVDEGLLQLSKNESWKILESMMGNRPNEVNTSTAQSQIVGKRHFGLKALAHGGGGGNQLTRELVDTLLLWKGRVPLDDQGNATLDIPLNDALTSFKIVAIASAGKDRFGTGSMSIRSTQDLMILSGIPPLAREGDRLPLRFTLRNTTAEAMEVQATLQGRETQKVQLPPGSSSVISWNYEVPAGVASVTHEIHASVTGKPKAGDRLRITQVIKPAVPVRSFEAVMGQLDPSWSVKVQRPVDALPGKGAVRVNLSSSLTSGLSGVEEALKVYPYTCLEQKVSKAIVLSDETSWKKIMSELATYLDGDGLARYFPQGSLMGSEILTSYLLSIAHEKGWKIPESERLRMIEGLQSFVNGKVIRARSDFPAWESNLLGRKLTAFDALSRYGALTYKQVSGLEWTPYLWSTSSVIEGLNSLLRIQEAENTEIQPRIDAALGVLRTRLDYRGSQVYFKTELQDQLDFMMTSGDANMNRFLLTLLEHRSQKSSSSALKAFMEDLPRMTRGSILRQVRGSWDSTLANAWGSLAVKKFAQSFESVPVKGTTEGKLEQQTLKVNWTQPSQTMEFAWPTEAKQLALKHQGTGKPWALIESRAAIPLKDSQFQGYSIRKTWLPLEQKVPGVWSQGDLVRVRLEIDSSVSAVWVAVQDPIPAGSTLLGSGLGNDSRLSTQGEKKEGWVWPAFEERSFESYRVYYEYVPATHWVLEYTLRLNQSGMMNLPSTRVEALYSREIFGELPNSPIQIRE